MIETTVVVARTSTGRGRQTRQAFCLASIIGLLLALNMKPATTASADTGTGNRTVFGLKASRSDGSVPLTVRFDDVSEPAKGDPVFNWHWDFGDGETSNQPRPAHTYTEPGTYSPSLTVITVCGKSQTKEFSAGISVKPGIDSDNDGISDADEIGFGTHPSKWDSDGDSFGDGNEVVNGSDPLTPEAELAANALSVDAIAGLEVLGKNGDTLVLFYSGPLTKAPMITPGMILVSSKQLPNGRDGEKGFWDSIWGFCCEVAEITSDAVSAGEEIVVGGVTYVAEATADGLVLVVRVVTTPLVDAFANMDVSFNEAFSVSTDDTSYFPEGSPLTGRVLYQESGLVIVISHGEIRFSPEFEGRILIEDGELVDAKFVTTGNFFVTLDLRATVEANCHYDSGDILIAQAIIPVGTLPVTIDLELNGQVTADFTGYAETTAGFESSSTVALGGRYYQDAIHNECSFDLEPVLHQPTFELEGHADAKIFLKPKIDINLYDQAGAYAELRPFIQATADYPCPPLPSINVGVDAEFGLYASCFGLVDLETSFTYPPDAPYTYTIFQPGNCGTIEPSPSLLLITASAGAHGSISPNGAVAVEAGQPQSFAASPAAGYTVDRWYLDGVWVSSQTGQSNYTLDNIQADHTVLVTFVPDDTPANDIHVFAPSEGAELFQGRKAYITWDWDAPTDAEVNIDLYRGASDVGDIATGTRNDGSCSWDIPSGQTEASDYRVRVSSLEGSAVGFSDGYFSIVPPYDASIVPIDNAAKLQQVCTGGANPRNAYYKLMGDLDISGVSNWDPLGAGVSNWLQGTFDGQGYTISGLRIERPAESSIGLFEGLRDGGTIKNLTLITDGVYGYELVGALVGQNQGTIRNCHVILGPGEDIQVEGGSTVGGLAGDNDDMGIIHNCSCEIDVGDIDTANDTSPNHMGGLVGENFGEIRWCWTFGGGTIQGSGSSKDGDELGGIVGTNAGSVTECYSTIGLVHARYWAGGIVGRQNGGLVSDCFYSSGHVSANTGAGGIVGKTDGGAISRCYVTGSVDANTKEGRLVGDNIVTISDSFYTGSPAVGNGGGTLVNCQSATSEELTHQATFTNWDFVDTWMIEEGVFHPTLPGCIPSLAMPTAVEATSDRGDCVLLTWSPVSQAVCYMVFRADFSNGPPYAVSDWVPGSSYQDTSATPLLDYWYYVVAALTNNGAGQSELQETGALGRRLLVLAPPDNVIASDLLTDGILIQWDAVSGASHYKVWRASSSTKVPEDVSGGWITETSFLDATALADTPYQFTVQAAADDSGTGASAHSDPAEGQRVGATGSLRVLISPESAVNAGARWSVDGSGNYSSGFAVTNLMIGTHIVSYSNVTAWNKPGNQTVSVEEGRTTDEYGVYVRQTGSVRVTTVPPECANAGARWRVDDGAWKESGTTQNGVVIGSHTLEFLPVRHWETPSPQLITVENNVTGTATGTYVRSECVLTVQATGSGSISVNGDAQDLPYTAAFDVDASVTVEAIPATRFIRWEGDVADPNSAHTTVLMDADKTIALVFGGVQRPPETPSSVSPNGCENVYGLTPTLVASPFIDPDEGDTLYESAWRVLDGIGGTILATWWLENPGQTQTQVPEGVLQPGNDYYWQVGYQDSAGNWSDWSILACFLVVQHPPETPSPVWPDGCENLYGLTPTLVASPFIDPDEGDTLYESAWRILDEIGGTVLRTWWLENPGQTQAQVPEGVLQPGNDYYWQVGYQDSAGNWSDWSSLACFYATGGAAIPHTADRNANGQISLSELLRVIQFYNSDGLQCAANPGDTEDGFIPGPGVDQLCAPHASDYAPSGPDWLISLSELLRLIQFYNSNGYHCGPGTEDGFAPGPGALCPGEGEGEGEGEGQHPPETPSPVWPDGCENVFELTPTLEASAFIDSDEGDTLYESTWRVLDEIGGTILRTWYENPGQTQTQVPQGFLQLENDYYWQVGYQDSTGKWSDWSTLACFHTAALEGEGEGEGEKEAETTVRLTHQVLSGLDGYGYLIPGTTSLDLHLTTHMGSNAYGVRSCNPTFRAVLRSGIPS